MVFLGLVRRLAVRAYYSAEGAFGVEMMVQLVLGATETTTILLTETSIIGPGVMGHEKKILFIGMVGGQGRTPDYSRACQAFAGINPVGRFLVQLEVHLGASQTHTGDGIARRLSDFILAWKTKETDRHTDILLTDTTHNIHRFMVYARNMEIIFQKVIFLQCRFRMGAQVLCFRMSVLDSPVKSVIVW